MICLTVTIPSGHSFQATEKLVKLVFIFSAGSQQLAWRHAYPLLPGHPLSWAAPHHKAGSGPCTGELAERLQFSLVVSSLLNPRPLLLGKANPHRGHLAAKQTGPLFKVHRLSLFLLSKD